MVLTVIEAKKYLRLEEDYTSEDEDIESLIMAAEQYLINAGCILIETDNVAKLAIKMLVVHWYENREPTGQGNQLAYGLQSLIAQLKYCYDTSYSGGRS
ncbi:phage gp6-like head-tail connector protein [Clostridium sp. 19966]|uniref:head-tail connector protein n=1 Tax=Clostridium sp. 19966 TaxID=2768166 RepID=UPI0028DEC9B9|nr:head-tail connector protein [Clostridium sp. 19966]MDT8717608.1 phage gp6-like head-tail connector protein [Clostridium sp. 19966]